MYGLAKHKITIVSTIILLGLCGIAFSLLLLKSAKLAFAIYLACILLPLFAVSPFAGLLNYLVLLYLRPQEFIPALQGLPVMFVIGGLTSAAVLAQSALARRSLAKAPQTALMMWLFTALILSHLSHLYVEGTLNSAKGRE